MAATVLVTALSFLTMAVRSLAAERAATRPTGTRLQTKHYDLYVEAGDPDEFARILEQAYPQWRDFFGSEPTPIRSRGERLKVKLFATREAYLAGLAADGALHELNRDAHGCFAPDTGTAYLWNLPSPEATRYVLLHEGSHQFHVLTRANPGWSKSDYHDEGIAEYFSNHCWDGRTLRLGVGPNIALHPDPAVALSRFDRVWQSDLARLASARSEVTRDEYVDAWALVTFLIAEEPDRFRRWSRELDGGAEPARAWEDTFGELAPDINRRYTAWLRRQQRPWRVVAGGWQEIGSRIEGTESDPAYAMAIRVDATKSIRAQVELRDEEALAGLAFDCKTNTDFCIVAFDGNATVRQYRFSGGKITEQNFLRVKDHKSDLQFGMSLRIEAGACVLSVDGKELDTFPSSGGELGLMVRGAARFRFVVAE